MGFNSINKNDKINEAYEKIYLNESKLFMFMRAEKRELESATKELKQLKAEKYTKKYPMLPKTKKKIKALEKEITKLNKNISDYEDKKR